MKRVCVDAYRRGSHAGMYGCLQLQNVGGENCRMGHSKAYAPVDVPQQSHLSHVWLFLRKFALGCSRHRHMHLTNAQAHVDCMSPVDDHCHVALRMTRMLLKVLLCHVLPTFTGSATDTPEHARPADEHQ